MNLPSNLDAEEQILGTILATGEMPTAVAELTAEDFHKARHRDLFAVLRSMHSRGETTDVVSVNAKLNGAGGLWIRDLAAGAMAIPEATAQHVALVREATARRRAIESGQRVIDHAAAGEMSEVTAIAADLLAAGRGSNKATRLGALSRTDSLELIAAREPEWRVRRILSTDGYGSLAGKKGVGKTLALADLGVGVALGEPWFGRFETTPAVVLFLTSEDSRATIWRRADAIAKARGRDPAELDGRLFVHPVSFSAVSDLNRLEAELDAVRPGLVLLDPAYRYMHGVKAQLFDMGAVLTPLQEACSAVGAPLLVGHHFNRRDGAEREERLSGAGILEWSRLVITAEAPPRRDEDPDVVVRFEITGNSVDPLAFNVRRRVVALDDSPNPELQYESEVLAEGAQAREATTMTAAQRVLAVLPNRIEDALLVREIGDRVAHDATGRSGLKHDTIRRVLNRDLADRVDSTGGRMDTRWWLS